MTTTYALMIATALNVYAAIAGPYSAFNGAVATFAALITIERIVREGAA